MYTGTEDIIPLTSDDKSKKDKKTILFIFDKKPTPYLLEILNKYVKPRKISFEFIFNRDILLYDFFENVGITKNKIVFWEPVMVFRYLELVRKFPYSITIIDKPTLLVQKLSERHNPVNENLAINNNFYIYYKNPDDIDITNDDWRIAIHEDNYLLNDFKFEQLFNKFFGNE